MNELNRLIYQAQECGAALIASSSNKGVINYAFATENKDGNFVLLSEKDTSTNYLENYQSICKSLLLGSNLAMLF